MPDMLEQLYEAKRTLDALPRPTPFSECVHGNFIYYRVSEHCVERDEDGNPIFFAIKSFGAMIVNPVNVTYLRDAIRQAGYTPLEVETPPAKLVEKEEPCQHTSLRL